MLQRIGFKFSIKTMLVLLLIALSYHLIIIAELIPYEAVWGGRLTSIEQMRQFELFSITINLFMVLVILSKGAIIKARIPLFINNIFLWLFTLMFVFNTVGNFFAMSLWEAIIFTPITFISAILCLRLALERKAPVSS